MVDFGFGFLVGALVVGLISHRKPEWFASIVATANAVDDKVNTQIKGQ